MGMHDLLLAQSHQLTLAHDTIQEQIGAVEAASRAKSDFLANMSHEIRTPLNAIVGMTELLLDSSLTPRQREYAGTVIDSCENLLAIINDMLDFSKIESGRLELERIGFDLREHLGDTLQGPGREGLPAGDRVGLSLRRRRAAGDRRRPGAIAAGPAEPRRQRHQVHARGRGRGRRGVDKPGDDGGSLLHFRVVDTGIGIPPEKLDLIFDAFEQADTSTTREYGGTGLGLAISRRLVNMMHGKLWVESEVGRGSTFHFTDA